MKIESKFEGWQWLILALIGVAILAAISPHHIGVLAWVSTQLAVGAFAGYWIDRTMFPHARPGDALGDKTEARHARYRRALLIVGAMLAVTVGM